MFGKSVVENPTYGLVALGRPATIFYGIEDPGGSARFYLQDSDWPLRVGLACDPAVPVDADISVALAEGVVSAASGAPVKDGAGRTSFTVRLPASENSVACRTWRETRPPETLSP